MIGLELRLLLLSIPNFNLMFALLPSSFPFSRIDFLHHYLQNQAFHLFSFIFPPFFPAVPSFSYLLPFSPGPPFLISSFPSLFPFLFPLLPFPFPISSSLSTWFSSPSIDGTKNQPSFSLTFLPFLFIS